MSATQESCYPQLCRMWIIGVNVISDTYHDVVTWKLAPFSFYICHVHRHALCSYLHTSSGYQYSRTKPFSVCILNWCLLLWLRILVKAAEMLLLKPEPTHSIERKLLMRFPLPSPKDKHFFLQLIQLAEEGAETNFKLLSTKNHGVYPRGTLENTRVSYIQARLTQMLIQQRPVM